MTEHKWDYSEIDRAVCKYLQISGLAKQIPTEGEQYSKGNIRLLIVGRCMNEWERGNNYYHPGLPTKEANGNVVLSLREMFENNKNSGNNLLKYPIWHFAKAVWKGLCIETDLAPNEYRYDSKLESKINSYISNDDDTWYEHIAWYNLIPIAPVTGWNPDALLIDLLRPSAKDMLKDVIAELKPTHILFMTDMTDWMHYKSESVELAKQLASGSIHLGNYHDGVKKAKENCYMLDAIKEEDVNSFKSRQDQAWKDEISFRERRNYKNQKQPDHICYAFRMNDIKNEIKVVVAKRPEWKVKYTTYSEKDGLKIGYVNEVLRAFFNM